MLSAIAWECNKLPQQALGIPTVPSVKSYGCGTVPAPAVSVRAVAQQQIRSYHTETIIQNYIVRVCVSSNCVGSVGGGGGGVCVCVRERDVAHE